MRTRLLAFVASLSLVGCLADIQGLGSNGSGGATTDSTAQGGASQGGASQGGAGGAGGTTNAGGEGGTTNAGGAGGAPNAVAYARFGHMNGQETVGDFCVAYESDALGNLAWASQGILAANQLDADAYAGLGRLTSYLPLEANPVAFGFAYPGSTCTDALGWWGGVAIPPGYDHFTVLAVPYSGEAMMVWAVGDPVATNENPQTGPGVRVVNASSYSQSIDVSVDVTGNASLVIGKIDFANSPTDYVDPGTDHLFGMNVVDSNEGPGELKFDFTQLDLLPVRPRTTIYYTSGFNPTALACRDTSEPQPGDPKSAYCYLVQGQ